MVADKKNPIQTVGRRKTGVARRAPIGLPAARQLDLKPDRHRGQIAGRLDGRDEPRRCLRRPAPRSLGRLERMRGQSERRGKSDRNQASDEA